MVAEHDWPRRSQGIVDELSPQLRVMRQVALDLGIVEPVLIVLEMSGSKGKEAASKCILNRTPTITLTAPNAQSLSIARAESLAYVQESFSDLPELAELVQQPPEGSFTVIMVCQDTRFFHVPIVAPAK